MLQPMGSKESDVPEPLTTTTKDYLLPSFLPACLPACHARIGICMFISFLPHTEAPILWPPDEKNWLIGKDSDAGKDWRQEEKQMTGNGMVGWHQWLDGHEFEQAPGVGDGQGGLACCSPWSRKESDTTEWLNWTELNLQQWQNDFYIIVNTLI